jgi:hypothetical protein
MCEVEYLIVVDTDGAVTSRNLQGNVSIIQSSCCTLMEKEVSGELVTTCKPGQLVKWKAVPKSPDSVVEILGFKGQMVSDVCKPTQKRRFSEVWEGMVNENSNGIFSYSIDIVFDGIWMSLNPRMKVSV